MRLPKIKVYKDGRGKWRWKVVAGNGRIIRASSQGYVNKEDCLKNLNSSVLTMKR